MRNTSPRSPSASLAPTRRTRYRCSVVPWRSKITPNAAGSPMDAAMASASVINPSLPAAVLRFASAAPGGRVVLEEVPHDLRCVDLLVGGSELAGVGGTGPRV